MSRSTAPLSLADLREQARSPDATPQDVDALLVAMARPVWPGEKLRARADVLHLLIEDPVLGGLRGRDGRRVDETAVQALVALGEPYASELSEDGRRLLQRARALPPPPRMTDEDEDEDEDAVGKGASANVFGSTGLSSLLLLWGLVEGCWILFFGSWRGLMPLFNVVLLGAIYLSVIQPALLLRGGPPRGGRRTLYTLTLLLELLMIPFMVFVGLISFFFMGSARFNEQILFFALLIWAGAGVRVFGSLAMWRALAASRVRG